MDGATGSRVLHPQLFSRNRLSPAALADQELNALARSLVLYRVLIPLVRYLHEVGAQPRKYHGLQRHRNIIHNMLDDMDMLYNMAYIMVYIYSVCSMVLYNTSLDNSMICYVTSKYHITCYITMLICPD